MNKRYDYRYICNPTLCKKSQNNKKVSDETCIGQPP